MNHFRNLSIFAILALFSAGGAQSQDGTSPTKHFEKDGITFDYPADWSVSENSSSGLRILTVVPPVGATQIVVSTYRGPVPSCDYEVEMKRISGVFGRSVAKVIKASAPTGETVTTQLGTSEIAGIQLQGFLDQQPALGDVYTIRLNQQFVSLAFVRKVDDLNASSAWQTVRASLKVEAPGIGVTSVPQARISGGLISGGVLNGKALRLPRPDYPPIARSTHVSGMVAVQVTIDESGDVVSAHAVSGHPLLQPVCVAAARDAKFSPTKLCGEPVKVTGIITYNFVAQ